LTEVNLIDNNFNLPRDWKSNLSLDVQLKKILLLILKLRIQNVRWITIPVLTEKKIKKAILLVLTTDHITTLRQKALK
jgi:hypothetical protein